MEKAKIIQYGMQEKYWRRKLIIRCPNCRCIFKIRKDQTCSWSRQDKVYYKKKNKKIDYQIGSDRIGDFYKITCPWCKEATVYNSKCVPLQIERYKCIDTGLDAGWLVTNIDEINPELYENDD